MLLKTFRESKLTTEKKNILRVDKATKPSLYFPIRWKTLNVEVYFDLLRILYLNFNRFNPKFLVGKIQFAVMRVYIFQCHQHYDLL